MGNILEESCSIELNVFLKKKIQMKPPNHHSVTHRDKASVVHHHSFIRAFEATHL